jgi:hypothetical protein
VFTEHVIGPSRTPSDVEELPAERGIEVDYVTCSGSRRCWPTPPGSLAKRVG